MSEELLVHQARIASFGQDTSRLHERSDGKKAWRVEFSAGEDEKTHARTITAQFMQRWRLDQISVNDIHLAHVDYLERRMEECSRHKDWYKNRLIKARAAHERLGSFVMHAYSIHI